MKDKVEARWRETEIANRSRAKADQMVEKINGGAQLSELAAADKLNVQWANGLKRRGNETMPPQACPRRTPQGSAGTAEGKEPTERFVFRVVNINLPTFDASSPDIKPFDDGLKQMSHQLLTEYLIRLKSEIGAHRYQPKRDQPGAGGGGNPDMQIEPTSQAFAQRYTKGSPQVGGRLWWLTWKRRFGVHGHEREADESLLLKSVEGSSIMRGHYSIIQLDR